MSVRWIKTPTSIFITQWSGFKLNVKWRTSVGFMRFPTTSGDCLKLEYNYFFADIHWIWTCDLTSVWPSTLPSRRRAILGLTLHYKGWRAARPSSQTPSWTLSSSKVLCWLLFATVLQSLQQVRKSKTDWLKTLWCFQ